MLIFLKLCPSFKQRQAERIKREKAQIKRGDDAEPQFQPESLVPVARFHGSRLASGPLPSPYQPQGSSLSRKEDQSMKTRTSDDKRAKLHPKKVACLTSGATIGAAIVEAENSLEIEVCFTASREAL